MTVDGMLAGKVVLITGAGRGIGAATARLAAAEGASVVLAARSEDELRGVVEEIRAAGGTAEHRVTDVSRRADVEAAVAHAVSVFGRLDGAFNNAGVLFGDDSLTDVDDEQVQTLLTVNLTSTIWSMDAQSGAILETAGTGSIVNNSSVGGWRANPRVPVYGATKRAVNSLTQSAAVQLAPKGVRVNAVAPGATLTKMMHDWDAEVPGILDGASAATPLGRAAQPSEIAEAVVWLLSDRSSFVTGVVLPVDGGSSA